MKLTKTKKEPSSSVMGAIRNAQGKEQTYESFYIEEIPKYERVWLREQGYSIEHIKKHGRTILKVSWEFL